MPASRIIRVRQVIDSAGHWRVSCLPRFHSIEGRGVRIFTPRRNQSRVARRCAADEQAQRFLGWKREWIDWVLAPETLRERLDPRPEAWIGDTLAFGVTRSRSRDIIGHAWIDFESDVPEIGLVFRPDQRRSGLGGATAIALRTLLHRHLGFPVCGGATSADNPGGNGVSDPLGVLVEQGRSYVLPDGRLCTSNVYRHGDRDAVLACRWGIGRELGTVDEGRRLDPAPYLIEDESGGNP